VSDVSLPESWEACRFDAVARVISGKNQKDVESPSGDFPIYGSGGSFGRATSYLCEPGTTVIGRKGTINSPIFVNERFWNVDTAFGLCPLDSEALLPRLLYYFCRSFNFAALDKSTTIPSLAKRDIEAITIPLPPLAEQKRIVAKIEELFSELEAGEESLRVARRQLGVYRQSLLKQAFEGKLTAKWRTQNPAKLESPVALIDAIRDRSRNAEFKANDDHKIPSWSYRTLDELTESVTSGSRGWADYYAESGSIFIRAQNLNQDFLNLAEIAYVQLPESAEGKRTRVKYGDLLITITGANTTKAGWVSTQLDEAYVSQHVALCRPVSDSLSPFLYRYIIADTGGRKKLTTDAYGAGKPGLNLDNVRSLTVPLPSLPEQQEIVRLLDEQFEVIERNEREIDGALRQSEALRQAILKKAFTGRLVPQVATDEPASTLLARLRTERAAAPASKRKPTLQP
jgi:type I restriction enzyme S subunit